MEILPLWEHGEHPTTIRFYPAETQRGDGTVIIFAGGGYRIRAPHEDAGYAARLNAFGLHVFTVDYRVSPDRFPLPLLDARRAVRYVRANAAKFGVNPDKIAVMGSSAGGHLAAMTATYRLPIDGEGIDEVDALSARPDLQILCYPVITLCEPFRHKGSAVSLLGEERVEEMGAKLSPNLIADAETPPAFVWHTSTDQGVPVSNSCRYVERLAELGIPAEMHIFPMGKHGLGLAESEPYLAIWSDLLRRFLVLRGFLEE